MSPALAGGFSTTVPPGKSLYIYIFFLILTSFQIYANIFFHLVGCLFILLTVSFAVQKLFSLYSVACLVLHLLLML